MHFVSFLLVLAIGGASCDRSSLVNTQLPSSNGDVCKDGFMEVSLTRRRGEAVCQLRVSDVSMKRDGILLVEAFTRTVKYLSLIHI